VPGFALTDARIYAGGADFTGQSNKVDFEGTGVDLLKTTFGSQGWNERVLGIKSSKADVEGLWFAGDPGQPDDRSWADLVGGVSVPLTLAGTSGAVGAPCYVTKALDGKYHLFGKVGDLAPFSLSTQNDGPVGDGNILHPQGTARTTSGNGTGVQIGALTINQRMVIGLHVLSVAGTGSPTITVAVQSNVDNTFGAPTTRATFTGATAQGGQLLIVAGPITDTWWRATWTITGTTPSFLFAVSAGIA
jgi:hypothetical protein